MDRKAVLAILFRVLADLAILASVLAAAVLADHGKSWWVWSAFLLFGMMGLVAKVLTAATSAANDPVVGPLSECAAMRGGGAGISRDISPVALPISEALPLK